LKTRIVLLGLIFLLFFCADCAAAEQEEEGYRIVINIPRYSLTLFYGDSPVKTYPIAVGKAAAQTPTGSFSIINKAVNPTWHPSSRNPVPPGPANPLGKRWMGFYSGYGIHGNNDPGSVGKSISKGCIRMYNYDVSVLYSIVGIGTPVEVVYGDLLEVHGGEAVTAYRDIYSRERGYRDRILEELRSIGLEGQIGQQKMENLFSALGRRKVVFAKNWALMVNGEFLTSDTIYDRTMIFVNCDRLNEFFGIKIGWNDEIATGRLRDKPVSAVWSNGKLYASIADLVPLLGGRLSARGSIEELNYEINFAKLNGGFLTSDVGSFKENPTIDIGLLSPSGKGRASVSRLEEEGFTSRVYSKAGYIELMHYSAINF